MKKHEGCERGFHQASKSWYGKIALGEFKNKEVLDTFSIGFYAPDGGTTGEFVVEWTELTAGQWVPQLQAFDDGWDALFNFQDMLKLMADADDKNISPDDFRKLLLSCGIVDLTKEKQD